MNEDLKIIKKKYGEEMMHLCRGIFPTLLETPGLLPQLMTSNFHESRDLYRDIMLNNLLVSFKNFIYSFVAVEQNNRIIVNKSAVDLLAEAGYDLYECRTRADVEKFRKYYAEGEELCTFDDDRLYLFYIFFAVKKNVDEIKRENFSQPERQDLYGTSVMSIQFTKDKSHTLSIKNRYNETVFLPDATFSNNLDNIIPGLTNAFARDYGMIQQNFNSTDFSIPGYVRARDGRYYKYNYEINNIYYCPDNIIIDSFLVQKYPKEKYIILDYFMLDLQNKTLGLYDEKIMDSFLESIPKIEDIVINNIGTKKEIRIKTVKGDVLVTVNKGNQIIALNNELVRIIGDNFMFFNEHLGSLSLPNAELIGNSFLFGNATLTSLILPKAVYIGHRCLFWDEVLTEIEAPNLKGISETGNEKLWSLLEGAERRK